MKNQHLLFPFTYYATYLNPLHIGAANESLEKLVGDKFLNL